MLDALKALIGAGLQQKADPRGYEEALHACVMATDEFWRSAQKPKPVKQETAGDKEGSERHWPPSCRRLNRKSRSGHPTRCAPMLVTRAATRQSSCARSPKASDAPRFPPDRRSRNPAISTDARDPQATGRYWINVWDYAGGNTFSASRDADLTMHPAVEPWR
jgi:hypothetical protein